MIVEPFEPISEPRVCGWPHHGFLAEKQPAGGGYNSYSLFINGEEIPVPADFTAIPSETRNSFKIRHPDAEPIDLTPEEIHAEALEHRSWKDFATISGYQSIFYGAQLGYRAWIAVLSDNRAWRVALDRVYNPAIGQMEWVMAFSRYAYGPVYRPGQDIGYRSFSIRIYDDAAAPIYFSSYTATNNIGHTLVDIGVHGRYALIRFYGLFPIRVPSAADLASMGINLDTVSGALNIQWCPIVDNRHENSDKSINYFCTGGGFGGGSGHFSIATHISSISPIDSYRVAMTEKSVALINNNTISASSVLRFDNAEGPEWGWTEWWMYDIPPVVLEWDVTYERKAHIKNNGDEEFVMYKSKSLIIATLTASGVYGKKASYWAGGSDYPPPASAQIVVNIKNSVEYGSNQWSGTSTLTFDVSDWFNNAGNADGVLRLPMPVHPGFDGAFAATNAFVTCPESTSSAVFNYSVVGSATITAGDGAPVIHKPVGSVQDPVFYPALSTIPPGTYYKGEFVSSWLPSSSVVWAYDYSTGDIISLPRPATADSEGYLYVTYV